MMMTKISIIEKMMIIVTAIMIVLDGAFIQVYNHFIVP